MKSPSTSAEPTPLPGYQRHPSRCHSIQWSKLHLRAGQPACPECGAPAEQIIGMIGQPGYGHVPEKNLTLEQKMSMSKKPDPSEQRAWLFTPKTHPYPKWLQGEHFPMAKDPKDVIQLAGLDFGIGMSGGIALTSKGCKDPSSLFSENQIRLKIAQLRVARDNAVIDVNRHIEVLEKLLEDDACSWLTENDSTKPQPSSEGTSPTS